jgi:hypothetical protein
MHMTRRWIAGAVVIGMLVGPAGAAAEPGTGPIAASIARLTGTADETRLPPAAGAAQAGEQSGRLNPPRRRSVGRRILGGAALGAAGFFGGGYLGARIEGDCNGCDDPGLKGALIGAPIGAAVGAVVGALWL